MDVRPATLSTVDFFPLAILHESFNPQDENKNNQHSLQYCVHIGVGVLVMTLAVAITILVTETIPPGMFHPETGRLRYISDGFADHRIAPFVCLWFIGVIIVLLLVFCWEACKYMPNKNSSTTQSKIIIWTLLLYITAFGTLLGFSVLAVQPDGDAHFFGAGLFMFMHIFMQLVFMHILIYVVRTDLGLNALSEKQQSQSQSAADLHIMQKTWNPWWIAESIVVGLGLLAAVGFGILLFAGMDREKQTSDAQTTALYSWSAASEYMVFVVFILLNVLASMAITFVGLHFEAVPLDASETECVWVWKDNQKVARNRIYP